MGVVDEIKNRLDIVDLVSSYVPSLKRAGRTYKGLCPFHSEKTPSFVVFPETQTWHCFGACGTGGDIFSFIMRQEGYDFGEALKVLAAKAGVLLHERSPEAVEADQTRRKLLELIAVAATYFHKQLLESSQAEFAREYVAKRGLTAPTIQKFKLGYAPNQWEALKTHLQQRGYSEKDMGAAGLLVTRDDGSASYDRFRDRFIVPIRDIQGRVVGFGARALHDDQIPKYLNSPQSILFDKSTIVFGLDLAKSAIREAGQVVIVEGYMDVLQAHQQGYANVVAEMGTALTEQQLKQLKRFTNQFVLALDADSAGNAATLRGINVARAALIETVVPVPTAQGLIRYEGQLQADISVAALPVGKDPDDILKEDPAQWQTLIAQALPLVEYYFQAVSNQYDLNSGKGKSRAVQTLLPILREIGNSVEQAHYLQQLARLVKIDERTLREELLRSPATQAKSTQFKPQSATTQLARYENGTVEPRISSAAAPSTARLERHCLAMIVGQPDVLDRVNQKLYQNHIDVLAVEDFTDTENGTLFLAIKQWAVSESRTLNSLLNTVSEPLQGTLAGLVGLWHRQPSPPTEYVEKELPKIVVRMRRRRLERQNKELAMLQSEALEAGDYETVRKYQKLVSENKNTLNILDKAQDALSIMGRRRLEEKYQG